MIQKVCRNCGIMGHIARVCSRVAQPMSGPRKRPNELTEHENNPKIAAIEGEMKDEVREDDHDLN